MNKELRYEEKNCDLCVIGGGLAGSFAALAAARHGAKVILIQDRPMLGGNASSEIRMWIRGAKGIYNREAGLISELEERNIYGNPTLNHSLFDATLFGMLYENENIEILLNTSCADLKMKDGKIESVTAWQLTTYTWITVKARLFADCSGDSILAAMSGAEYRKGREAKSEFGETLAQDKEDSHTMGMSIILAARETDHPVKFTPPPFATKYPDDEAFKTDAGGNKHALVRSHRISTDGCNLWWVELGGHMDSIYDTEKLRDQLLANIYGVWDHIKNHGDHGNENWELEWVGFLPGKRESRRYVGDVIVTENDINRGGDFEDEIAFGGWPMDDHNPYGMLKNPYSSIATVMNPVNAPYGLPFRALYSKNVENLMFAGRNISASHIALSSTRVMATCALLGQAMGTGAALAIRYGETPRGVYKNRIKELQRELLDDGMFLPHIKREISEQTRRAEINISTEERARLFNGVERPRDGGEENGIYQQIGDSLIFKYNTPEKIKTLRMQFDPDYTRDSVTANREIKLFAMKINTGFDFKPVKVACTIPKAFTVYADGKEVYKTTDNYRSFVKIPLNVTAKEISVKWEETNGAENVHIFAADFI